MSFDWVEDVLNGHLASGAGKYANSIAWKNLPFEPGDRKLWLKSSIVPAMEGVKWASCKWVSISELTRVL